MAHLVVVLDHVCDELGRLLLLTWLVKQNVAHLRYEWAQRAKGLKLRQNEARALKKKRQADLGHLGDQFNQAKCYRIVHLDSVMRQLVQFPHFREEFLDQK